MHHRIHQFISGKAFRDLLLTGTDVLTKNQATKWLSDDRMNAVLRPEDVEWSHEHWFPQTALAGWKWWAIVQPEKTVGQVTMKNLAATYGQYGITSKGSPIRTTRCGGSSRSPRSSCDRRSSLPKSCTEERRDSVKSHGVSRERCLGFTRCAVASRWPVRQGRHRSATGSKARALTLDHYHLLRHSAVPST